MCPRQGSHFLLLRQKKVTKEKATPFAGRPRADFSALLGLEGSRRTHFASCARSVQTGVAKSDDEARLRARPSSPALLDGSQGPRDTLASFAGLAYSARFASCLRGRALRAALGGDAKRAETATPSDELSSAGLCGARVSAHQQLTSGRLSERSSQRPRSEFDPTRKDRAAQGSPRAARAESAGVASLPTFLSIQESRSPAGAKSRRGLTQ
jgi:hypothetical protein